MEMKDNNAQKKVKGAEAIVIHNMNIVLGMQKEKRWYNLENGEKAVIIKTLGGRIEGEDENNSRRAIIREVLEEVEGIEKKDIIVTKNPIFTKRIRMGELNIFEKESELSMEADFYNLKISSKKHIAPNDLPALLEIPIEEFLKLEFNKKGCLNKLKEYIIKNEKFEKFLPKYYTLMIPKEVREFLRKVRER